MNSTGYAWGTTDGGAWLTIPGSYHKAPSSPRRPNRPSAPTREATPSPPVERYTHPAVTGSSRAFTILEKLDQLAGRRGLHLAQLLAQHHPER